MRRIQIHPLDDWGFFFDIERGDRNEVSNRFTNLYTIYESDEDEDTTNCLHNYAEILYKNFFNFFLNLFSKVK